MYEIFELLLKEYDVTTYQVAKATGISTASFTGWKQGKWNFKADKLQKIADYFGVSIEYLMTGKEDSNKKEPQLKPKDEKDIKNILSNTEQLLKQPGLMFEGKPASQESIDSILSAMKIGMEIAKKKNKELYTPKRYKEEQ